MSSGSAPRLLADIGGTNARFGLQRPGGKPQNVTKLSVRDYPKLASAIQSYLRRHRLTQAPTEAAFAVASPAQDDVVKFTNSPWQFSIADLGLQFKFDRFKVVNDFSAIALSVPRLANTDTQKIGRGRRIANAAVAVLGPGTGLGVSGIIPTTNGYVPLASEGGHVTLAASDDWESEILSYLREQMEHVSAERLLSGPGLTKLYEAVVHSQGRRAQSLSPSSITRRALSGSDHAATTTVDLFCALLGTVASNLALTLGALGGVYIAGGIVPKLGDRFRHSSFRARFEQKGRFGDYLARIPTHVIIHPAPAFLGLIELLDRR